MAASKVHKYIGQNVEFKLINFKFQRFKLEEFVSIHKLN